MIQNILIFLIVFAAGLLIMTFVGIVWMTSIWENIAKQVREKTSQRALEKRGVKYF